MVNNQDMFFLHLDLRYLFSKLFDIMFQQVLFFILIALLLRRKLSLGTISVLCCGLLGASHLYLLRQNGFALGGYFVLFSMAAGLTFPFLIVRCRTGLVYTSSLHLLFYVVTGQCAGCAPRYSCEFGIKESGLPVYGEKLLYYIGCRGKKKDRGGVSPEGIAGASEPSGLRREKRTRFSRPGPYGPVVIR